MFTNSALVLCKEIDSLLQLEDAKPFRFDRCTTRPARYSKRLQKKRGHRITRYPLLIPFGIISS